MIELPLVPHSLLIWVDRPLRPRYPVLAIHLVMRKSVSSRLLHVRSLGCCNYIIFHVWSDAPVDTLIMMGMRGRNIMRATEGESLIDENGKDSRDKKSMAQMGKKQLLNV